MLAPSTIRLLRHLLGLAFPWCLSSAQWPEWNFGILYFGKPQMFYMCRIHTYHINIYTVLYQISFRLHREEGVASLPPNFPLPSFLHKRAHFCTLGHFPAVLLVFVSKPDQILHKAYTYTWVVEAYNANIYSGDRVALVVLHASVFRGKIWSLQQPASIKMTQLHILVTKCWFFQAEIR